ncbi:MAG: hypothetical protein ACOCVM_08985 [Desulfovibrionaceae bacterium]
MTGNDNPHASPGCALPATAGQLARILESMATRELSRAYENLNIHKIELESQNEELRDAQIALEDDRKRCLDAGMDDDIARPLVLADLDQVLQKNLRKPDNPEASQP